MLATLAKRFIAESSCTVVMFEASRRRILPNPALPPDRPAPKAAPGTTARAPSTFARLRQSIGRARTTLNYRN
jgi:hypothetical protein